MSELENDSGNSLSMDKETADLEFERLIESWGLSTEYDAEEKASVVSIKQYIKKGVLVVKEGKKNMLVLEHNLHKAISKDGGVTSIIYQHILVEDLMGLDNISAEKTIAESIEYVYALTKTPKNLIKKMTLKDLSIGGAIGSLFLVY